MWALCLIGTMGALRLIGSMGALRSMGERPICPYRSRVLFLIPAHMEGNKKIGAPEKEAPKIVVYDYINNYLQLHLHTDT